MGTWARLLAVIAALGASILIAAAPASARERAGRQRQEGRRENRSEKNGQELRRELSAATDVLHGAQLLRREAIAGRIPDPEQPAEEVASGKVEPRWVELSDAERLARFDGASKKHAEALKQAEDVAAYARKHEGLLPASVTDRLQFRFRREFAQTLVAEARFHQTRRLGEIEDWLKIVQQARKVDPDYTAAERLEATLERNLERRKLTEDNTTSKRNKDNKPDREKQRRDTDERQPKRDNKAASHNDTGPAAGDGKGKG